MIIFKTLELYPKVTGAVTEIEKETDYLLINGSIEHQFPLFSIQTIW